MKKNYFINNSSKYEINIDLYNFIDSFRFAFDLMLFILRVLDNNT